MLIPGLAKAMHEERERAIRTALLRCQLNLPPARSIVTRLLDAVGHGPRRREPALPRAETANG